jgi:hypothetical protein
MTLLHRIYRFLALLFGRVPGMCSICKKRPPEKGDDRCGDCIMDSQI